MLFNKPENIGLTNVALPLAIMANIDIQCVGGGGRGEWHIKIQDGGQKLACQLSSITIPVGQDVC